MMLIALLLAASLAGAEASPTITAERPASHLVSAESLPDGFEILDRCVDAIGGEKAYRKHKSEKMSGSLSIPAVGVEGTIVVRRQATTKTLVTINLAGLGEVVQGTNGEVAWSSEAGQPAKLLSGPQANSMINEANFYGPVEPRKTYTKATLVDTVEFDGVECYKLELVTSWGAHQVGLFEVESGLHRKTSTRASADSDLFTTETTYSDYRKVRGVKRPHKLTVNAMGIEQVIKFDEIEFGAKFDKDLFTPPSR
ncbi:MAG: hypothetical protein Phyf2KO_23520 [Phycisphaerales bacterium]